MTASSDTTTRVLPAVLRPFATPHGAICALALDHRDALRNAYARAGHREVSEQTMLDVKARILAALGGSATSLLLDEAALDLHDVADVGVFMPLEAQGHDATDGGRLNRLLDGFAPADALALGAQGCKLLLYYRHDHAATARAQRELAARAAELCHRDGLALVVEPKAYRLDGEREEDFDRTFAEHVTAGAAAIAGTGADLLKLQFPGDAAACRAVERAAGSVPWTLLGGADVDGGAFAEQLHTAAEAGACGFIAGRAIWGGALALPDTEQADWLEAEARPLFERLVDIADTHARRAR